MLGWGWGIGRVGVGRVLRSYRAVRYRMAMQPSRPDGNLNEMAFYTWTALVPLSWLGFYLIGLLPHASPRTLSKPEMMMIPLSCKYEKLLSQTGLRK